MKIAIVNDVAMIAEAMRRMVVNTREHQVAWVAHGGAEAVRFCANDRPDLILMDLVMPDMDGAEATRRIMSQSPCAILVVTASPDENTSLVFRAMGAGALDVVATPVMSGKGASDSVLLAKIRMIGKLVRASNPPAREALRLHGTTPLSGRQTQSLVAFGASTGGPAALTRILGAWHPPPDCCAVIVQHIDVNFADSFAAWLSGQIGFRVQVIDEGTGLQPGAILLAKSNDHLVLTPELSLCYSREPATYPYRPSVDVFFRSVALNWRRTAAGVLLTGMGRDGGHGLLAMRTAGKLTIAQDRASSAVYGMPRAAADLGGAEIIASLDAIAGLLSSRLQIRESGGQK